MQFKKINGLNSLLILLFVLCSCQSAPVEQVKPADNSNAETFVRVNKLMLKKDKELIKTYIKRHNFSMTETESGLWVEVYKPGKGANATNNKTVKIKYTVELLDGTKCYSSDSLGIKEFVVGAGRVESGLDEGVLNLKVGSKARLILPPHLAFGLSGDSKKIPPRSIIVYDIELLSVSDGKFKN